MGKVLVLGAYGNFGKRIATALTKKGIQTIVAGRSREKAIAFAETLPADLVEIAVFDVRTDLEDNLHRLKPAVVINTCGPFQIADYSVATTCILNGVHIIDLADGRDFVTGISVLDELSKASGITVISGASTVPCLSSALIEEYASEFSIIESLRYGIAPGQKTERGLATTQAILSYVGKRFRPFAGAKNGVFGWQDLYLQRFPDLGLRLMSNCEIPDLDLLPPRYGIQSIRFSASLELSFMHFGLWLLSWIIRIGLPLDLPKYAGFLLKVSDWFDGFGSADSGMHLVLKGRDREGKPHERRWFILAKSGHGLHIPTVPSVILAEKLVKGTFTQRGALTAVGLVSLSEYLAELKPFSIGVQTDTI